MTWIGDKCFCHHSNISDLFSSNEVKNDFTLFTEAADMMLHFDYDNSLNTIGIGFPHLPSLYKIHRSKIPKTLKKWYSTNVNIDNSFFNIDCCPIGVYDGYLNNGCPTKEIESAIKLKDTYNRDKLCLMNFNINNRQERYDLYNSGKLTNWVSVDENKNQNYGQVLLDILSSKFVICPISNGVETSRVWDCVYSGAIPIVLETFWSNRFKDLPILEVQSWNSISKSFLENYWNNIHMPKLISNSYNYNKIDANYWTKFTESI